MIVNVLKESLDKIKNSALSNYAGLYVKIYEDFMEQIAQMGVEIDAHDYSQEVEERVKRLRQKGAHFRNGDKSIFINNISPACVACQTGEGSATFFISLKCHRGCFYCFNPNQENYEYFLANQRNVIAELEQVSRKGKKAKHLALTGGEPLLYKAESVGFFRRAHELHPSAYTRLYTSGDQINAETLKELRSANLQEIRFSIRMHDLEKGHRHTFNRIALAKEFIPYVMVEMPVLPGTLETMKEVLLELERLDIFSINLLEFCYPMTNPEAFNQRSFRIKNPPFRVLYNYWYAGGLPIARSELECLDLLAFALDQDLKIGVHYCSLENKHTGQIYQQNANTPRSKTVCFSHKDYFLKSAKVFGEDIPKVRQAFKRKNFDDYLVNREHDYLEFPLSKIRSLGNLEVEIGISSNVIETRSNEKHLRELKVDLTTPQMFEPDKDI